MNLLSIIKYQLYLLQLENYELGRYFKLLWQKGFWPKGGQRKNLVWTGKAILIFGLAELLILGVSFFLSRAVFLNVLENSAAAAILFFAAVFILQFFGFIFLTVCTILTIPLDWFIKQIVIGRARIKIKKLSDLKIIGIAGSYGKTTMKEVLKAITGEKLKVESTPESINTPVGIARWVLNNVTNEAQILIVEMGEHYSGDIKDICKIAQPDIAVVTGINESHLERMKNMETVVSTVFEIVSGAKPGAAVVLNGDDNNVFTHYKEYIWPDNRVIQYQVSSIKNQVFDVEELCWHFEIDDLGKLNLNLLGEYALADVDAAIKIAKFLGMTNEEIKKGIAKIKPVEHRLQPIQSAGNVLVVDDAYNGNPQGVKEAIKVLSRFTDRRKIYITPGLVEMGKASKEVHLEIGKELAGVADVVILVKNSVTPWIEEGLNSADKLISRSAYQLIWFSTAQEAHAALPKILKPGDVILFQNDWGDQYV